MHFQKKTCFSRFPLVSIFGISNILNSRCMEVALAASAETPAVELLENLPNALEKRREDYYSCRIGSCRVAIKWDTKANVTRCPICSCAIPHRSAVIHVTRVHAAWAHHFVAPIVGNTTAQ